MKTTVKLIYLSLFPRGKGIYGKGIEKMREYTDNRKKKTELLLYIVVCCVTMVPVASGRIMDGGVIGEWISRIYELSVELQSGHFLLFPSKEAIIEAGMPVFAMNSNLWFLLPAIIYWGLENVTICWQIYMILIQAGTLITSILMFHRLFKRETERICIFFGVIFYMTCPYRIYVCYDLASMSSAVVWLLIPLYVWAAAGITTHGKLKNAAAAALALAGIGYADIVQMLVIAGITVLAALWFRKPLLLASIAAGGLIALPGILRLGRYLFGDTFGALGIPLNSIMESGYVLGEFFSVFVYREGHPGTGLGVLSALVIGLWLCFVKGQWGKNRKNSFFIALSVLLLIFSLKAFPWDFVQRLGVWALKMIPLFRTPAMFFGFAQIGLCVPAACAVGKISRQEEKALAIGLPLMVLAACIALCIYQCNELMSTRLPL